MEEYSKEPRSPETLPPAQPGEPVSGPDQGSSEVFRFLIDLGETLLLAIVLYFAINAVTARIRVDGSSMEPTLHDGEYIICNRIPAILGKYQRGDVIVFRFPGDPKEEYIKRIIGFPGDVVKVENKKVYVNGKQLNEPYIAAAPAYSGSWTVSEGGLFVLGDNRNNSSDSHSWGLVPENYVIGKAILIYWPPGKWGIIKHAALIDP